MEQSKIKEVQLQRVQDYLSFDEISRSNGWLVFENTLKEKIEQYVQWMNNVQVDAETLKNYQLIKFGLEKALAIPKELEIKAKSAKKELK